MTESAECRELRLQLAQVDQRRRAVPRQTQPMGNDPTLPAARIVDSERMDTLATLKREEEKLRARLLELGCAE